MALGLLMEALPHMRKNQMPHPVLQETVLPLMIHILELHGTVFQQIHNRLVEVLALSAPSIFREIRETTRIMPLLISGMT